MRVITISVRPRFHACYPHLMGKAEETVLLDDDVQVELSKLAMRSGRLPDALANAALRDYLRYENEVGSSIEQGLSDLKAGRVFTTSEVLSFLEEQRRSRPNR